MVSPNRNGGIMRFQGHHTGILYEQHDPEALGIQGGTGPSAVNERDETEDDSDEGVVWMPFGRGAKPLRINRVAVAKSGDERSGDESDVGGVGKMRVAAPTSPNLFRSSKMTTQIAYASADWPILGGTDTDTDPFLDKIGGSALWLSNQPNPHGHPKCKQCASEMYLLSQILASPMPSGIPNASMDRILYVFACNKADCSKKEGSFTALRAIRVPTSKSATIASTALTTPQLTPPPLATTSTTTPKPVAAVAPAKPTILAPTHSKQPQNPPKFRMKMDAGIPFELPDTEEAAVVAPKPAAGKKKKASIFASSAFGAGDAFDVGGGLGGGFGGDTAFGGGAFGTTSAFGGPSASSGDGAFGQVSKDDEISKLLSKRDKSYVAWVDEEEEEAPVDSNGPKKKSGKGKKSAAAAAVVDETADPVNELQEGIDKMEIGTKQRSEGPHFPGYALEFFDPVEVAGTKKRDDMAHEMQLLAQYQKAESVDISALLERGAESSGAGVAGWEGEVYEKAQVKGATKAFKKFQKEVAKYPEQCVRYGFTSDPLLYNEKPFSQPPPCPHCTHPRVFEMQLMPALLTFLPTEQYALKDSKSTKPSKNAKPSLADLSAKGVDFGTILVFTCSKNCLGAAGDGNVIRYVEETVVIRQDDW
ncbi:programmed cell death protein [Podochytrium sp. JEL0797]|nr:programmed cell death protein [Podochytrium sp. JEL0797]